MTNDISISEYDCIGFDLDNTLVEYQLLNLSNLIYEVLTNFLVTKKGYCTSLRGSTYQDGMQYVQKGLLLDFDKGNIVKISHTGIVLKACHGTNVLSDKDINKQYGAKRIWTEAHNYSLNILGAWNDEKIAQKLRCLLDYFDAPCALLYARIIDSLDRKKAGYSEVWPDILSGLYYMYDRQGFKLNIGEYFPSLRSEPSKFIKKNSEDVVQWLKSLRDQRKFIFLLTGSDADYASFIAEYSLGKNWLDFFDLVICFARKPNFFLADRPFIAVEDFEEKSTCQLASDVKVVSQGNYKDLQKYMANQLGKAEPRVIYVGDNIVQDVMAPIKSKCCDAIAVCGELDKLLDVHFRQSPIWGSYIESDEDELTLWKSIINEYSSLCVPSVQYLAQNDISRRYSQKIVTIS